MLSHTFVLDVESAVHTLKTTEKDPEKRKLLRGSFGVSGEVDLQVINRMWKAHRDPENPDKGSLAEVLPEFHRRLRNREQLVEDYDEPNNSGIKALMMMGTIALLNIEDSTGKVETELNPFLTEVKASPDWEDAIQRFGVLLVGNTENEVRCQIVVYVPNASYRYSHLFSNHFCFRMWLNLT